MASARAKARFIRLWEIVEVLRPYKRGLTRRELLERIGGSKSTLYRDLGILREAGVPIQSDNSNGEVRHTLWGHDLPQLGPSMLQLAALRLARRALIGLDGTSAAAELDKLLEGYARAGASRETITFAKQHVVPPEHVKKLDSAIVGQRRTRIRYRSASARTPEWRTVDPLGLRYAEGHLYFVAHDDKRKDYVPFKLDRISAVDVLAEKAPAHPDFDVHALFARSAKIWTGSEVDVAVRLSAAVARFVHEYPLVPHQTVGDEIGGACVVRARVAGAVEAMRWVLSWGKEAQVLEPAELKEKVSAEVMGAAALYRQNGRKKAAERARAEEAG